MQVGPSIKLELTFFGDATCQYLEFLFFWFLILFFLFSFSEFFFSSFISFLFLPNYPFHLLLPPPPHTTSPSSFSSSRTHHQPQPPQPPPSHLSSANLMDESVWSMMCLKMKVMMDGESDEGMWKMKMKMIMIAMWMCFMAEEGEVVMVGCMWAAKMCLFVSIPVWVQWRWWSW